MLGWYGSRKSPTKVLNINGSPFFVKDNWNDIKFDVTNSVAVGGLMCNSKYLDLALVL